MTALKSFFVNFDEIEIEDGFDFDLIPKSPPLTPEGVYDAIRKYTKIDSLKGRQEDAEEFLGFLLDGLHEALVQEKPVDKIDSWERVGRKNKVVSVQGLDSLPSEITRIFRGTFGVLV